MIKKLFKEPLFQFLIIALVLLGGERWVNADDYAYDQYSIQIDDQQLLQFMQLRAKTFKPEQAQAALDAMNTEDRQRLVDDYARNEVMFREAMAIGLDKNDQLIRRRLIQKMDYLAQGFYDEAEQLKEADLRAYYAEHKQDYKKAAEATFTHVFISTQNRSVDDAKAISDGLLVQINADRAPFENASRYGERFLYNRNYVNREDDEIGSHFGQSFQETVFALSITDQWQGPLQSSYGWHLVLLVKNTSAYVPEFEEVSSAVFADAQRQQQREVRRQAIDRLMAKYQIETE
jgi:peptidyl-prolyl cis-trans isomerase C